MPTDRAESAVGNRTLWYGASGLVAGLTVQFQESFVLLILGMAVWMGGFLLAIMKDAREEGP